MRQPASDAPLKDFILWGCVWALPGAAVGAVIAALVGLDWSESWLVGAGAVVGIVVGGLILPPREKLGREGNGSRSAERARELGEDR